MRAAEVMTQAVVSVGPETPVREVALTMLERRISGVPVIDAGGRVLGVVSEGDLIRRPELETDRPHRGWLGMFVSEEERARDFVKSHGLTAREVMTQPAVCVSPETPLDEIVTLMERHRVKRLPVVAEGRLAGIVTRADLLQAMVARPARAPAAPADGELRERVVALLRGEDWAASAMVSVEVESGVVRLWGTVSSAAQRDALLLALRAMPGVRAIEPHLGRALPG